MTDCPSTFHGISNPSTSAIVGRTSIVCTLRPLITPARCRGSLTSNGTLVISAKLLSAIARPKADAVIGHEDQQARLVEPGVLQGGDEFPDESIDVAQL